MWLGIGIPKYVNMHKSQYKFVKKRNKCNVTIKSIIIIKKASLAGKKKGWNYKRIHQKRNKIGERERERERERELICFGMYNLQGIGERGGNEIKRNL